MYGVILDANVIAQPQSQLAPLQALDIEWQIYPYTSSEQTLERIKDAQIIVTNKVLLNAKLIQAAKNLKLICIAATGTNNVDLAAAEAAGIQVRNVSGYSTASVVQHTIAFLIALLSNQYAYAQRVAAGAWQQSKGFCLIDESIHECAGKTLGIIGYGNIGQAVANVAKALGMEVLIAARPGSQDCPTGRVLLEQLLPAVDALSLHCPLSPETGNLINKAALEQMKSSAVVINCARGGIVDELALAQCLKQGRLAGAALDVLSQEPPPADHPLLQGDVPNLIITPHNAWASFEARQRLIAGIVNNIQAYCNER